MSRETSPYLLEINYTTKQYIPINRDYEYIGFNTRSLSTIIPKEESNDWKRVYLYNGQDPWLLTETDLTNYFDKLKQTISGLTLYKI